MHITPLINAKIKDKQTVFHCMKTSVLLMKGILGR